MQADLWTVLPGNWGAALCYATGSKTHNEALRTLAKSRGLKINEYGIWKGPERIGGEKEEDLYNILGITFVSPEDREAA